MLCKGSKFQHLKKNKNECEFIPRSRESDSMPSKGQASPRKTQEKAKKAKGFSTFYGIFRITDGAQSTRRAAFLSASFKKSQNQNNVTKTKHAKATPSCEVCNLSTKPLKYAVKRRKSLWYGQFQSPNGTSQFWSFSFKFWFYLTSPNFIVYRHHPTNMSLKF